MIYNRQCRDGRLFPETCLDVDMYNIEEKTGLDTIYLPLPTSLPIMGKVPS